MLLKPGRRFFVGVTDSNWYRFLRVQPDIDEVNFWMPKGARRFGALAPGEPFLFKLHAPENFVVGGGFFSTFSSLPCSLAWEAFGIKNGAPAFAEMRRRIGKYRGSQGAALDYEVGCIILGQPFFFDEHDWIPIPPSWAPNIVQGKTFSMDETDGNSLWTAVSTRLARGGRASSIGEVADQVQMFSDPALARHRLGQGAFRVLITDTYERRCAATGEKTLPVLEAAHIRPVAEGGQHRIDNGLLLRSDLHRLYDRGCITITPDHVLRVSQRLREEFGNGKIYYPYDGQHVWTPLPPSLQPDRDALAWHAEVVFKA